MTNVQSVLRIKRPDRGVILTAVILVLIYALVFVLEQILPPTSMLFTVLMAKTIGGILPLAAKAVRMDPAIMASPLITTIVDAVSLVIYFNIASALLPI